MNPVGIFVPVSEIFKDTESDFEVFKDLLRSLSLTDTLFCSMIAFSGVRNS
jgi:hypothetical protein